jgi:hypothetical protein
MLQLLYTGVSPSFWHVAIVHFHDAVVYRLCCKSLRTCCICVLDMLHICVLDMLQGFHVDVSKLCLNFSMLQILIFDAANVEY